MRQQDDLTNHLMEIGSQQRAHLIWLCTRMTGKSVVAEDLAQETLLKAWKHLHTLRDPQRFSSWLAGIARNLCLRWKRAQARERTHIDEQQRAGQFLADDRAATLVGEIDLEIELERRELAELLDRALALLPAETRLLLIERYIQESPLAEIADRLGISLDTATKRLQRGRLAFRHTLTTNFHQELAPYLLMRAEGSHPTPSCQDVGRWAEAGRTTPPPVRLILARLAGQSPSVLPFARANRRHFPILKN